MKGAIPAVSTEKPVRIAASKVEGVEAVMASVTGEFGVLAIRSPETRGGSP